MKFSSSLKFNAVVEWWDEYIAYDTLKKYIYQLEKQQHEARIAAQARHDDPEAADEHTALFPSSDPSQSPDTDAVFRPLLDTELRKISSFYQSQEKELLQELKELEELVESMDRNGVGEGVVMYEDGDEDDDDDDDDEYDEDWNDSPVRERSIGRGVSAGRNGSQRGNSKRRRGSSSLGRKSGGHAKEVTSPRLRRVSISSTEENTDLEQSLASLRQVHLQSPGMFPTTVPEGEEILPHDGPSSSILPSSINTKHIAGAGSGKTKSLARKLASSIASLGGSPHPPLGSESASSPVGGRPETIWNSKSEYATDTQLLFKRRITNLYVQTSALKQYVELNYSGFRKILKKYDKVTENTLQSHFMHTILEPTPPFDADSRSRLTQASSSLLSLYSKCVTHDDFALARRQLKLHLREHIAWERDTVWRTMIARERRGTGGGGETSGIRIEDGEEEKGVLLDVGTPVGRFRLSRKVVWLLLAVVVGLVLGNVECVEGREANTCLAILVFATILWATEAIPLFVTSTAVPLLLVCFRVVRNAETEEALSAPDATKWVFSVMFSPTIMLLIGGFTIAAALSKTSIDRVLITRVLSLAGTRPSVVLLAVMGVACFASMWISNVAAPTLCFTLVRPILRTLPPHSSFAPCLILAIALAANIGGQSSPISSPQNLITLNAMDPKIDWGRWFAVSLPVSGVSIFLIWLLLLVSYRPARLPDATETSFAASIGLGSGGRKGEVLEIKSIRPSRERFSPKQWYVAVVTLGTIVLWCVESLIEDYVGDMGVIAIIPILAFFGTGVLKKDDFEQFLWSVVFIAMGGIALGKGVTSSGLLDKMDVLIREVVDGLSLYSVVLVLSFIVLVISTFISHTIASVLLVPIAKAVGSNLPGDQSNLLIFITGLICSTGMGMPVSGFPNQTAATQEDEMGQPYLSNVDFLKNGVPASVVATLVVSTLGFAIMKLIGI